MPVTNTTLLYNKRWASLVRPLLLSLAVVFPTIEATAQVGDLPRTSPEAVGLRSEQVAAFMDSLLAYPMTEIHSVIVMRHGWVVGEMYPSPVRPDFSHTLYSCSKTFTAAAVGIAIAEKRLRLTDRLVTFFPDKLPNIVSWQLASITVEDLLTMRSGFAVDTKMRTQTTDWTRAYLAHPMNATPGKRFQYDSIDTYLLSAILQKVTGMTLLDYLKSRLFNQLNIRQVKWEQSPEGITTGGWGLYLQPESMAKFGQLLLQRGQWQGKQLIPAKWVDQMLTCHVSQKSGDGYGYQVWMCAYPTAVRADGAFGQYIVVVPKEDVVVVITQCTLNSGKKELSYIWRTLFAGKSQQPLPPSTAYKDLLARSYTLPLLQGKAGNKLLAAYLGRSFALEPNPLGWDSLRIDADNTIQLTDARGRKALVAMGYQEWCTSAIGIYPPYTNRPTKNSFSNIHPPFVTGACYAWEGDKLLVKIHFADWMSSVRMKISFYDEEIGVEVQENYQKKPFTIVGRATPAVST